MTYQTTQKMDTIMHTALYQARQFSLGEGGRRAHKERGAHTS